MRFIYSLLFVLLAGALSGQQCISVQVDSVFCTPNSTGYFVSFDVEGFGDSLWQLQEPNGNLVFGAYNTDEIFTSGPYFDEVSVLLFQDITDPNCANQLSVVRPEGCGNTDPCFGFFVDSRVPDSAVLGAIEVFTVGGAPPLVFILNDGTGGGLRIDTVLQGERLLYEDLAPGFYTVSVQDSRGCTVTNQFAVDGSADCSVAVDSESISCNGSQDGTATANATGVAPFSYAWSNGASTRALTGLERGSYFVTVTDAEGCSSVGLARVGEPEPLSVEAIEIGNGCDSTFSQGSVTFVNVTGGVLPYAIEVLGENGDVTCQSNVCNTTPGEVLTVNVVDANGCSVSIDYVVPNPVTTINWFAPFFLGCDGEPVTISVADEGTDYVYSWVTPRGDTLSGASIAADTVGNYEVFGTSPTLACGVYGQATVEAPVTLDHEFSIGVIDSLECGFERCLFVTTANGNWDREVNITWFDPTGAPLQSSQNAFLCVEGTGLYAARITNACDTVILTQWLEANPECSSLNGRVYVDAAGNCSLDAGDDTPAPGVLVEIRATDGSRTYYALTNDDGYFGQEVVVGAYTIRPITQPTQPFGVCDPLPVAVVSAGSPTTVDVFLPALTNCPLLVTDVGIPFLRRCFATNVFVEYGNIGSATATDAQLTVTFDDFLIDIEPSVPASVIDGQTYTFDLGDLPPFAEGRIFFSVKVSCAAVLGQTHCIEADITPNDPCVSPAGWNGALVNVTPGSCNGDSLSFDIANVGDNAMTVPLSYIVIEDGIMMRPVPVIADELEAGEVLTINLPANGTTYHVVTNQEPNAPVTTTPTAMLEGCVSVPNGAFSTGFANILSLDNGGSTGSIACRVNRGAYDPNDKNGYPLGYGTENNIARGTRLDYAVRFQNTGTDTAFTVVIRDTISTALDLATFKAGASSHDYTVSIDTNRVVTFVFANIMLPDSNVNLAASQGVVNFAIDHAAALEPGDYIANEVAIYFDFNAPVITNLSVHRIEKGGLPTGIRAALARSVSFQVYPNPGNGLLQLKVPSRDIRATDVLTVTDLYGRPVATTTYGRLGDAWNVSHLPAGYYVLVVSERNGLAKGRTGFVKR